MPSSYTAKVVVSFLVRLSIASSLAPKKPVMASAFLMSFGWMGLSLLYSWKMPFVEPSSLLMATTHMFLMMSIDSILSISC